MAIMVRGRARSGKTNFSKKECLFFFAICEILHTIFLDGGDSN